MLTREQKAIIGFLQGDIPVTPRPYAGLAEKLGISEAQVIKNIRTLKKEGYVRRFGAILDHHRIGLTSNCMCVWKVPAGKIETIAEVSKKQKQVSHCYLRKTVPGWDYNFYTMIHGASSQECFSVVEKISRRTKVADYKMLFTLKQLKKTSPKYSV